MPLYITVIDSDGPTFEVKAGATLPDVESGQVQWLVEELDTILLDSFDHISRCPCSG